jgi:hypothetical protein
MMNYMGQDRAARALLERRELELELRKVYEKRNHYEP